MIAALAGSANALTVGMGATAPARAAAPQMGVGLIYSTTTGKRPPHDHACSHGHHMSGYSCCFL